MTNKITNFYKRWEVEVDEERIFNDFKIRTLNSISKHLSGYLFSEHIINQFCYYVAKISSKPTITGTIGEVILGKNFEYSFFYITFKNETDFIKYVLYLQILFWIDDIPRERKHELYDSFKKDIYISNVNVKIKKAKNEYFFYPAGSKFFDKTLISEVLDWLEDYPDSQSHFMKALSMYQKASDYRNSIDELRLSLELLLKKLLNNDKSFENQIPLIREKFNDCNCNKEIGNMFNKIVQYYKDYQNNNVKHISKENLQESINHNDIEFVIYLTGIFMRYLILLFKNV